MEIVNEKKLLSKLKEKKKKTGIFFKNARKKVAGSMSGGKKKSPSPDQCREKFYSMRRAYRKYLTKKKKKTGMVNQRHLYMK